MKSHSQVKCSLILKIVLIAMMSFAQGLPQHSNLLTKKNFKKVFHNDALLYQDLKELAKRLEYHVHSKQKAREVLSFGLEPLGLNIIPNEEIAKDIEEGVEEEFELIDQEFGNDNLTLEGENTNFTDFVTLMHQGIYSPDPQHNYFIDGLVMNVRMDIVKRKMDPLYFGIHDRGIVRHSNEKQNYSRANLQFPAATLVSPERTQENGRKLLGIGILRGLSSLSRFGHVESRQDGNDTLLRSHYFFRPLDIEVIFATKMGSLKSFNSSLSTLAAHALFRKENTDNSTKIQEFVIDSPMPYEIRLRGPKNQRMKSLSQASLTRLFKRNSRMETRLRRNFQRALKKPIGDPASLANDDDEEVAGNRPETRRKSSSAERKRSQNNRQSSRRAKKNGEIIP